MDSTSSNKKRSVNHHDSEPGALPTHADTPRLYEIISDVSESVCGHVTLSHPIFDYIETTAQRTELRAFVHAEIVAEHRLLSHAVQGSWASSAMAAPVFGNPGYGAWQRTIDTASNTSAGNRYFALLHHAVLTLSANETVEIGAIEPNSNASRHTAAFETGSHFIFPKIGPIIRLVQANIYRKVLIGCVRLGVAPHDYDKSVSSDSTSDSIRSALYAALLEQPLDALNRAQALSGFLDRKVEYYDVLFNDILRST